MLGIVAHACNPSTWEAETGELPQVQGSLAHIGPGRPHCRVRFCLEKKQKQKEKKGNGFSWSQK